MLDYTTVTSLLVGLCRLAAPEPATELCVGRNFNMISTLIDIIVRCWEASGTAALNDGATSQQLQDAQRRLGRRFPDELRALYERCNCAEALEGNIQLYPLDGQELSVVQASEFLRASDWPIPFGRPASTPLQPPSGAARQSLAEAIALILRIAEPMGFAVYRRMPSRRPLRSSYQRRETAHCCSTCVATAAFLSAKAAATHSG